MTSSLVIDRDLSILTASSEVRQEKCHDSWHVLSQEGGSVFRALGVTGRDMTNGNLGGRNFVADVSMASFRSSRIDRPRPFLEC